MNIKNTLLAVLIVAASSALVACSSEPLLRPSATLSAAPGNVRKGNSTTLYWHAANAETVSITPALGMVDTMGSKLVTISAPTTYTLYARGKGGDTTVTLLISTLPQPPTVSLRSTPDLIKRGDQAKLYWTSQDATDLMISPTVGTVSGAAGEIAVSPRQTTAYTITARNSDGTTTASTTVALVPSRSRVIARIFFQTDKSAIIPSRSALRDNPNMANNKVVLDSLVDALKSRMSMNISITGNTDPRGGDVVNEPLSKARAYAIQQYLLSKGIDASRLNVKWVSDKNPLGPSDSDADQDLDRRTGVRIDDQSLGSLSN